MLLSFGWSSAPFFFGTTSSDGYSLWAFCLCEFLAYIAKRPWGIKLVNVRPCRPHSLKHFALFSRPNCLVGQMALFAKRPYRPDHLFGQIVLLTRPSCWPDRLVDQTDLGILPCLGIWLYRLDGLGHLAMFEHLTLGISPCLSTWPCWLVGLLPLSTCGVLCLARYYGLLGI